MKKIKLKVSHVFENKNKIGMIMIMCMMMFMIMSCFTPVYADGLTDTAMNTSNNVNNSIDILYPIVSLAVICVGLLLNALQFKKIGMGLVVSGVVCFMTIALFQAGLLNWIKDIIGI